MTLLRHQGHRLLEAADGREALATARAEHPDLVITDVLMPVMDGYEFVRQLRLDPATSRIPVVFYTAHYGEREARALALSSGVSYVLTKPAESAEVLKSSAARSPANRRRRPPPAGSPLRRNSIASTFGCSPTSSRRQAERPENRQRAVASADQYRAGARVRAGLRPAASERVRRPRAICSARPTSRSASSI